ncbi:hypothetical protein CsSME_00019699 [Camellia sinensis var. sinensis]
MEKALLGHESSGGGSSSSSRRSRDASALFRRRSDAITHGSPYQKAAALVDLAEDGVGLPEQILDQSSFETAAKFYFIFTRFDILWSLNYFALIVLNFLEVSVVYVISVFFLIFFSCLLCTVTGAFKISNKVFCSFSILLESCYRPRILRRESASNLFNRSSGWSSGKEVDCRGRQVLHPVIRVVVRPVDW